MNSFADQPAGKIRNRMRVGTLDVHRRARGLKRPFAPMPNEISRTVSKKVAMVTATSSLHDDKNYTVADPEYYTKTKVGAERGFANQELSKSWRDLEADFANYRNVVASINLIQNVIGYVRSEPEIDSSREFVLEIATKTVDSNNLRPSSVFIADFQAPKADAQHAGVALAITPIGREFAIPGKSLGAAITLFAVTMSVPTVFSDFYVLHPAIALALLISGITFFAMSYARKIK